MKNAALVGLYEKHFLLSMYSEMIFQCKDCLPTMQQDYFYLAVLCPVQYLISLVLVHSTKYIYIYTDIQFSGYLHILIIPIRNFTVEKTLYVFLGDFLKSKTTSLNFFLSRCQ